jgi:hypothetical protein
MAGEALPDHADVEQRAFRCADYVVRREGARRGLLDRREVAGVDRRRIDGIVTVEVAPDLVYQQLDVAS